MNILYCRKSTESEERQVRSIGDQEKEMQRIAATIGCKIDLILVEAKSAKFPESRPEFKKLIELIGQKKVQRLFCWQLDRLARNPVDAGKIIWALQQALVTEIVAYDRTYRPEDDVLYQYFEFGKAHQYVKDLSRNVKRGIRNKIEQGWWPGKTPLGYLNNPDKSSPQPVIEDPEIFPLVKQVWRLFLTGSYSLGNLLDMANKQVGLHTRTGKKLGKSHLYMMLTNPFYGGKISHNKELFTGKHTSVVTWPEFQLAQEILKGRCNPKKARHFFTYGSGLIKCRECASSIVGEGKNKTQKNGNVHHWTYYHCPGHKKDIVCLQTEKYTEEKGIEGQVRDQVTKINIDQDFKDLILKCLEEAEESKDGERQEQKKSIDLRIKSIEARSEQLLELRLSRQIEDQIFTDKKRQFQEEKDRLKEELGRIASNGQATLVLARKILDFSTKIDYWFQKGSPKVKRFILRIIGSNLCLENRRLLLDLKEPFSAIAEAKDFFGGQNQPLEPMENVENKGETTANGLVCSVSSAIVEDVRTYFRNSSPIDFTIFNKSDSPKSNQTRQEKDSSKTSLKNVPVSLPQNSSNCKVTSKDSFCRIPARHDPRKSRRLLEK